MGMEQDLWLRRWLALLQPAAAGTPVLELGCDAGQDTRWLLDRGFPVVATDLSFEALQAARRTAAPAMFLRHDLRTPLPFRTGTFGAVVASLCLHYFDARTTAAAIGEIRRCLVPGGVLFCRVNSAADALHGAGEGEEIEPGYYRQSARYAGYKRFFSAQDLDRFFPAAQWATVSREERTVLRYDAPKIAWELVCRSEARP